MKRFLKYFVLIIFSFLALFPFYWMFISASNPTETIFKIPITLRLGNHLGQNLSSLEQSIQIKRVFANSAFVALISVVTSIGLSLITAYALSFSSKKTYRIVALLLLISQTVPMQAKIVPLFRLVIQAKIRNTYLALIIPSLLFPFAILLLYDAIRSIPKELTEYALTEGASYPYIFLKIIIPNIYPTLATTSIMAFLNSWNNFLWPLIVSSNPSMYTIPVALSSLKGVSFIDYGQIMAGLSLATLPMLIFFISLQKYFMQGNLSSYGEK